MTTPVTAQPGRGRGRPDLVVAHDLLVASHDHHEGQRQRRAQPACDGGQKKQLDRADVKKRHRCTDGQAQQQRAIERRRLAELLIQTAAPAERLRHDVGARAGQYWNRQDR
ncbi:MAG: hypothetical protein GIX02_02110 [Candidatus Eremiobacteraeota bacterium]|nr:hypothetical protein [Candidatus Eremiobacteraeota bacterium]